MKKKNILVYLKFENKLFTISLIDCVLNIHNYNTVRGAVEPPLILQYGAVALEFIHRITEWGASKAINRRMKVGN